MWKVAGTDNAVVPSSQNTTSTDCSDRICAPNTCVSQPGESLVRLWFCDNSHYITNRLRQVYILVFEASLMYSLWKIAGSDNGVLSQTWISSCSVKPKSSGTYLLSVFTFVIVDVGELVMLLAISSFIVGDATWS